MLDKGIDCRNFICHDVVFCCKPGCHFLRSIAPVPRYLQLATVTNHNWEVELLSLRATRTGCILHGVSLLFVLPCSSKLIFLSPLRILQQLFCCFSLGLEAFLCLLHGLLAFPPCIAHLFPRFPLCFTDLTPFLLLCRLRNLMLRLVTVGATRHVTRIARGSFKA